MCYVVMLYCDDFPNPVAGGNVTHLYWCIIFFSVFCLLKICYITLPNQINQLHFVESDTVYHYMCWKLCLQVHIHVEHAIPVQHSSNFK